MRYDYNNLPDRMSQKIKAADNGCWEWLSALDRDGYGRIHYKKKARYIHRVSYEFFIGKIPDGLMIDHLCRNPCCCRPDHLEPVTNSINQKRRKKKIRCKRGHEFTDNNIVIGSDGYKRCKECYELALVRRKLKHHQQHQ